MSRKKSSFLFTLFILLTIFIASSLVPNAAPSTPSSLDQTRPQRDLALPSNQTGNGYPMNLTESVVGWNATCLLANNTLSSYQQRNSKSFSQPAPSSYAKVRQNITVSGLTAAYDVREVQYGSIEENSLTIKNTTGNFKLVAMRFTVPVTVNLTGFWARYSLSLGWDCPVSILAQMTNSTTPPTGVTAIGSGTAPSSGGNWDWWYVQLKTPVRLNSTSFYWVVFNGTEIPSGKQFEWGLRFVAKDNKYASGFYQGDEVWTPESTIANIKFSGSYFNMMLMLKVIAVNDDGTVKTYSSPTQVNMVEVNSNTPLQGNTTQILNPPPTFVLRADMSVAFTVNCTARFERFRASQVTTVYDARAGYTLWNANFTSDSKPSPITYPYTWSNKTFMVNPVPLFWNGTAVNPPLVWNNRTYASIISNGTLANGDRFYLIKQDDATLGGAWDSKWGVSAKSTYSIVAWLPSQVVAGLSFTLSISTDPYLSSWCNVSFFDSSDHIEYTKNVTITGGSRQLSLKLNRSDTYTLFLFDRVLPPIDEASIDTSLHITVLPAACNLTFLARTSPVIGSTAMVRFRFYNNSLGTGTTVINHALDTVTVNGTPPTSFGYDTVSGNLSVYMSTASGGWRTGNNSVTVFAKSGVFNATATTWVWVQKPLCNVTVISTNQPFPDGTASVNFKFYNSTVGASPLLIDPTTVRINGSSVPFSVGGDGSVTATWSVASGGWHVGLNPFNVSAVRGIFINSTISTLVILSPDCNVTVVGRTSPVIGNAAGLQFKFFNNSLGAGGTPMPPEAVSVNGISLPFSYDGLSKVTSISFSTAGGGWHTGNNTLFLSAASGTFNATTQTWIWVLVPLCNVTVDSVGELILGNPATAQFRFLNGTAGWSSMSPITVEINGTVTAFTYDSGTVTVSWSTTSGGWRSGLNRVNITAANGVFFNSTVYSFMIIEPKAMLTINATMYSAKYGDAIPIGFTFLNTTASGSQPFPSLPTLYKNGTAVSLTDLGGGMYAYTFNTRYFTRAGEFHINFTAKYGTYYVATNITRVVVSKIPMTMVLHLDQTSVTVGSSLSASATLSYDNGTTVEDGTEIVFRFTVTFANSTIRAFNVTALTLSGTCHAAFTATSEMKNISVEAIYSGDGIRAFASDTKSSITVTQPSGGFPVIMVAGAGGIGALVVGLAVGVVRRRKRGKEVEYKKTAALRQAASLAQLVVVDRKSGRAVFSRNLSTEETVDPHLISGFLSANESVLREVFRGEKTAGLKFADYGKYKVLTSVGDYVMTTLFCAVGADKQLEGVLELEDVLSKFTKEFERKYGRLVSVWDGDMAAFRGAENIVSDVFAQGISMLSPYMLNQEALAKAKLSGLESDACEEARRLSAGRGVFFITKVIEYLLTEKGVSRGKLMDTINSLVKRGVFKQLSMTEAEEIVKAGGLKR